MSRNRSCRNTCRRNEVTGLPPGSGFVLAGTIGFASVLIGAAVFLSGAGIGWAVVGWLVANTCGLLLVVASVSAKRPSQPDSCVSARCRFHDDHRLFGRFVNV
ncbi:hypothetical protein SAMN05444398_110140 [Roseovarius pacificus]|uniref:Uncharacterized protein n=1 Tax=Roseovarius pacificus TaxID=337701 RepID=A0A1M7GFB0_9RHOB|nr:hypothetical protein GCM10011315_33330 [Roseovarius pacificus]SHM14808.1 hypothetical protein SAMN05444398_110140 [Roseovarius pacificus]